jgi:hypothetical protein
VTATDDALRQQFEAYCGGMINLKRITPDGDYATSYADALWEGFKAGAAAQSAELARLRVLAGRYEFLRQGDDPDLCVRGEEEDSGYESYGPRSMFWGDELDAAIDAALASGNGGGDRG